MVVGLGPGGSVKNLVKRKVMLWAAGVIVPFVLVMAIAAGIVSIIGGILGGASQTSAVDPCAGNADALSASGSGGLLSSDNTGVLVMTFNVKKAGETVSEADFPGPASDLDWNNRGPNIVKMILAANPDVIGFQEVATPEQQTFLQKSLPDYTFTDRGTKGAAIPIAFRTSRFASAGKLHVDQINFAGQEGSTKNRYIKWLKLKDRSTSKQFYAVNLHAQNEDKSSGSDPERARTAANKRIFAVLDTLDTTVPSFVTGDFNTYSVAKRTDYDKLLAGMSDRGFRDSGLNGSGAVRYVPIPKITSINAWGDTVEGSHGKKVYRVIATSASKGGTWLDYVWAGANFYPAAWQIYTAPYTIKKLYDDPEVPVADFIPSDHWPVLVKLSYGRTGSTLSSNANTGGAVNGKISFDGINLSDGKPNRIAEDGRTVTVDDATMLNSLRLMISIGKQEGISGKGIAIAIMTAITESKVVNINFGDRDSQGLFQQRSVSGWGTPAEVTNEAKAIEAFYGYASHTNNPGLVDIKNWQSLDPWVAAQKVQRSAFADGSNYKKYWNDAVTTLKVLEPSLGNLSQILDGADTDGGSGLGSSCVQFAGGGSSVERVLNAGRAYIGLPYSWGGGDYDGPGNCAGGGKCEGQPGFDCSGLVSYAFYKGTGHKVPGQSLAMKNYMDGHSELFARLPFSRDAVEPGDIIYFKGHVALGGKKGYFLESRSGGVQEDKIWTAGALYIYRPNYPAISALHPEVGPASDDGASTASAPPKQEA